MGNKHRMHPSSPLSWDGGLWPQGVSNVLHFPILKNPLNRGFHALRVSPCAFISMVVLCSAQREEM